MHVKRLYSHCTSVVTVMSLILIFSLKRRNVRDVTSMCVRVCFPATKATTGRAAVITSLVILGSAVLIVIVVAIVVTVKARLLNYFRSAQHSAANAQGMNKTTRSFNGP